MQKGQFLMQINQMFVLISHASTAQSTVYRTSTIHCFMINTLLLVTVSAKLLHFNIGRMEFIQCIVHILCRLNKVQTSIHFPETIGYKVKSIEHGLQTT